MGSLILREGAPWISSVRLCNGPGTCIDMEVYMRRHRAILFGVILSLIAGANIDASTLVISTWRPFVRQP